MQSLLVCLYEHPRRLMALRLIVGIVAAGFCLLLSPQIILLASRRPGFVPIGMAVLLCGLLHPRIRHWFIISLCFSVALMAFREGLQTVSLPATLDSPILHAAYPFAWLLLAILSAAAGILEAAKPGSLAARRFYFASASVYFTGHGFTSFHEEPSWQHLAITAIGLAAAVAAGFAHRLDYVPPESGRVSESEVEREDRRRAAVLSHEWRDPTDQEGAAHAP